MKLIACLGNPGEEYEITRHNAGFLLGDLMADDFGLRFQSGNGPYQQAEGRFKGTSFMVIKPTTYMNLSGTAIRSALRSLNITLADALVCFDDLNLPLGTIRFRSEGSAGGHNGIQNIIDLFQTREFPRLRIGIGNDFPRGRQVEYVLGPFSQKELDQLTPALKQGVEGIKRFLWKGLDAAMNEFNRS